MNQISTLSSTLVNCFIQYIAKHRGNTVHFNATVHSKKYFSLITLQNIAHMHYFNTKHFF